MDPNGTRYHLLLGEDDWTTRTLAEPMNATRYDPNRQALTLSPLPFQFAPPPGDVRPRLHQRRGADRDAFGNTYWIDDVGHGVNVQSAGSGASSRFWTASTGTTRRRGDEGAFAPRLGSTDPSPAPVPLAGLAVTDDHYLVVGMSTPAGLLVFDLHAPASPRQILWPTDVAFLPFDLCGRSGGGVFVLDRRNRRLWELDRRFAVIGAGAVDGSASSRPDFVPHPTTAAPARDDAAPAATRQPVTNDDATALTGDPIAIAAAPARRVLVLNRNETGPQSKVQLLGSDQAPTEPASLEHKFDGDEVTLSVVGHDMTFVANEGAGVTGELGTLYVADDTGNQVYAFVVQLDERAVLKATLLLEHLPMRLFEGRALVAGDDKVFYDFRDSWVPLVKQDRPRYRQSATLYPHTFEASVSGTVWHRVLIDACIPPQTSVVIESRAANDERGLASAPWQPEPPVRYRRSDGSELGFFQPPDAQRRGTWEVLLQRARGRHLQLRLTMTGDGRTTPQLHALRVHYPRFSYLDHYLPAVYRQDPASASFLTRFLANLEGLLTTLEHRIVTAHALFDPRTAPSETLDWLLGWFDVVADPTWHTERRRLFLTHATELFTLRGTTAGIQLALRLVLDPCDAETLFDLQHHVGVGRGRSPGRRGHQPGRVGTPGRPTSRIVERYRTRSTPAVALGDPSELEGPREVPATPRWHPSHGATALQERWRAAVGDEQATFPLAGTDERWRSFMRDVVGAVPSTPVVGEQWTTFLATRYRRIKALNAAYSDGEAYESFADVGYPRELPSDGPALRDWYDFVVVAQPARSAAHRFTVLLPVPASADDGRSPEERRAIAKRIVDLQKPAHTTFDVAFFWSAFRVGEVRLGEDTLLDRGSRDPRLRQPLLLGREHAGDSYLAGDPPPTVGRLGRDTLHR